MSMDRGAANLQSALDWIGHVVKGRLAMHFGKAEGFTASEFDYYDDESWLARFIQQQQPSAEEFTILMLALAPDLRPGFFHKLLAEHLPEGGEFPEFGGVKGASHRGILPTGETAQFVLAGDDLEKRLVVRRILGSEHWFSQKRIL